MQKNLNQIPHVRSTSSNQNGGSSHTASTSPAPAALDARDLSPLTRVSQMVRPTTSSPPLRQAINQSPMSVGTGEESSKELRLKLEELSSALEISESSLKRADRKLYQEEKRADMATEEVLIPTLTSR